VPNRVGDYSRCPELQPGPDRSACIQRDEGNDERIDDEEIQGNLR
jgi:hypothetical protein